MMTLTKTLQPNHKLFQGAHLTATINTRTGNGKQRLVTLLHMHAAENE